MNVQSVVNNELVKDEFFVWQLKGHTEFGYSDGRSSEEYLERVFQGVTDLGTRSVELKKFIKDWPSEYHLTEKRAQLLSGFTFDRSLKVLEVGCGCGAITRFLGETFDQVVSVEGNINRARLAKLRTRDLDSVSVICAPFQEISFSQKFDVIFCVGVFEYSGMFIAGDNPYEAALKYFSSMLTPDGVLFIAIENQFGLKYFCGHPEDHLGVPFEGIEGYHKNLGKVRTFGKGEIEAMLKKSFSSVDFYYPYPDYKLPDSVLSSKFVASGRAGELISQAKSKNHNSSDLVFFDENLTVLELNKNNSLEFFANSFLIMARLGSTKRISFEQEAILYSAGRKNTFATKTRVLSDSDGSLAVLKTPVGENGAVKEEQLTLVETSSTWVNSVSLQTQLLTLARAPGVSIGDIFSCCSAWVDLLVSESKIVDNVRYLDGSHIDSIWANSYIVDGKCKIEDKEWVWESNIRLNVVVIRAIYDFLCKIYALSSFSKKLSVRNSKRLIKDIAKSIKIVLTDKDFDEFIFLETNFQWLVFEVDKKKSSLYLNWFLVDRVSLALCIRAKNSIYKVAKRITGRLRFF